MSTELPLKISPRLHVVESREYDRDRGDGYYFQTTHNGYQFAESHPISELELRELRDQITELIGE